MGIRLLSSSETYVVFGADTEEDTLVVERFVKEATKAIEYLESKVFICEVEKVVEKVVEKEVVRVVEKEKKKVEFKLGELPNDMKMLNILAGELHSNKSKSVP